MKHWLWMYRMMEWQGWKDGQKQTSIPPLLQNCGIITGDRQIRKALMILFFQVSPVRNISPKPSGPKCMMGETHQEPVQIQWLSARSQQLLHLICLTSEEYVFSVQKQHLFLTMYVLASTGENLHSTDIERPGGISPLGLMHSKIGWSKFSCLINSRGVRSNSYVTAFAPPLYNSYTYNSDKWQWFGNWTRIWAIL